MQDLPPRNAHQPKYIGSLNHSRKIFFPEGDVLKSKITLSRSVRACMLGHFSCVRLFETISTVVHQAPLSLGVSRQEHWSGLSFPSPGDLSDSGIKPVSPALASEFFTTEPPGKPLCVYIQG